MYIKQVLKISSQNLGASLLLLILAQLMVCHTPTVRLIMYIATDRDSSGNIFVVDTCAASYRLPTGSARS